MAFDLSAIQHDIEDYLIATFPQYEFCRNVTPEDEQVPRDADQEVLPYFALQFGPMWPRPRGKSFMGARNDEYYSWVQVIGIGSDEVHVADALALMVDRLLGYKPEGATRLIPDGGQQDYGSRQYSVRPVLYFQSQRFEFGITQHGLDGYLTA